MSRLLPLVAVAVAVAVVALACCGSALAGPPIEPPPSKSRPQKQVKAGQVITTKPPVEPEPGVIQLQGVDEVCSSWGDTHVHPFGGGSEPYDLRETRPVQLVRYAPEEEKKPNNPDRIFEVQLKQRRIGAAGVTVDNDFAVRCGRDVVVVANEGEDVVVYANGEDITSKLTPEAKKLWPNAPDGLNLLNRPKYSLSMTSDADGGYTTLLCDCNSFEGQNGPESESPSSYASGFQVAFTWRLNADMRQNYGNSFVNTLAQFSGKLQGACGWDGKETQPSKGWYVVRPEFSLFATVPSVKPVFANPASRDPALDVPDPAETKEFMGSCAKFLADGTGLNANDVPERLQKLDPDLRRQVTHFVRGCAVDRALGVAHDTIDLRKTVCTWLERVRDSVRIRIADMQARVRMCTGEPEDLKALYDEQYFYDQLCVPEGHTRPERKTVDVANLPTCPRKLAGGPLDQITTLSHNIKVAIHDEQRVHKREQEERDHQYNKAILDTAAHIENKEHEILWNRKRIAQTEEHIAELEREIVALTAATKPLKLEIKNTNHTLIRSGWERERERFENLHEINDTNNMIELVLDIERKLRSFGFTVLIEEEIRELPTRFHRSKRLNALATVFVAAMEDVKRAAPVAPRNSRTGRAETKQAEQFAALLQEHMLAVLRSNDVDDVDHGEATPLPTGFDGDTGDNADHGEATPLPTGFDGDTEDKSGSPPIEQTTKEEQNQEEQDKKEEEEEKAAAKPEQKEQKEAAKPEQKEEEDEGMPAPQQKAETAAQTGAGVEKDAKDDAPDMAAARQFSENIKKRASILLQICRKLVVELKRYVDGVTHLEGEASEDWRHMELFLRNTLRSQREELAQLEAEIAQAEQQLGAARETLAFCQDFDLQLNEELDQLRSDKRGLETERKDHQKFFHTETARRQSELKTVEEVHNMIKGKKVRWDVGERLENVGVKDKDGNIKKEHMEKNAGFEKRKEDELKERPKLAMAGPDTDVKAPPKFGDKKPAAPTKPKAPEKPRFSWEGSCVLAKNCAVGWTDRGQMGVLVRKSQYAKNPFYNGPSEGNDWRWAFGRACCAPEGKTHKATQDPGAAGSVVLASGKCPAGTDYLADGGILTDDRGAGRRFETPFPLGAPFDAEWMVAHPKLCKIRPDFDGLTQSFCAVSWRAEPGQCADGWTPRGLASVPVGQADAAGGKSVWTKGLVRTKFSDALFLWASPTVCCVGGDYPPVSKLALPSPKRAPTAAEEAKLSFRGLCSLSSKCTGGWLDAGASGILWPLATYASNPFARGGDFNAQTKWSHQRTCCSPGGIAASPLDQVLVAASENCPTGTVALGGEKGRAAWTVEKSAASFFKADVSKLSSVTGTKDGGLTEVATLTVATRDAPLCRATAQFDPKTADQPYCLLADKRAVGAAGKCPAGFTARGRTSAIMSLTSVHRFGGKGKAPFQVGGKYNEAWYNTYATMCCRAAQK